MSRIEVKKARSLLSRREWLIISASFVISLLAGVLTAVHANAVLVFVVAAGALSLLATLVGLAYPLSLDDPIPIASLYLVTVLLASGIPLACINLANSSSLSRFFGSSKAISSRKISFTLSELSKKSDMGISRPLGSSAYLFAVARLTVPSSRFKRVATSARVRGRM